MSRTLLIVVAILGGLRTAASAQSTQPATIALPPAIEQLKHDIRQLRPIQVRAAIKARFGPPTRDAGSGIWIPQWNVAGGTLTFHPLQGPTFTTRSGAVCWLLQTKNPARETALNQFEMTTPADPANHGTRFWIGDVYLAKDMTYRFVDGGSNLRDRGDQSKNFFINHPNGRVEIEWAKGITNETPLESAGNGVIAHLTFQAAGDPGSMRCRLVSLVDDRRLELSPEQGRNWTYELEGGWKFYWPVPAADDAEMGKLVSEPP